MHQDDEEATPVRLSDISKNYGELTAIDGLSLDIPAGQLCALLGRNGAGKTSAIRVMLGLTKPNSGGATIFGAEPGSLKARQRVGAMLQKTDLPAQLTVGELIDVFSAAYVEPFPRQPLLTLTGVSALVDRPYSKLSGGQQRLVQFAIALCGNPDLLLLDEPSTGLDADVRQSLWKAVRSLIDAGKTILLTTHYLHEAEALADRVLLLNEGHLVFDGTPEQIKAQSGGKRIRCRTDLTTEQIYALPGVGEITRQGALTTISTSAPEECLRYLLKADPKLHDLTVSETGLEDAFLMLTQTKPDFPKGEAA